MFETTPVLVGLEIGTTKVCATVGEPTDDGSVRITGIGQAKSRGVRKGEIVDPVLAREDIREAIVEAEASADVEISSVFLGVTGGHLVGLNSHASHPIASANRQISEEDVQDVIKNAKIVSLPQENAVVHVVRQHFTVNGQRGIQNPVGMVANVIEADVHVVHGNHNRIQSAIRLIQDLQLEVDDVVFNGIASSLAVLTNEQKELGALVIDFGAGSTEFVVYSEGIIKHTGILSVGGDHISNDLAYGLKVPLGRAEQLKIEHGAAFVDPSTQGRTISITSDLPLPARNINIDHLTRIMALRVEEVFLLIEQELAEKGLLDFLRAGVVICGGGSRIPGVDTLAARIFGMNVLRGRPLAMAGMPSNLQQPEFATSIGLVKFGAFKQGPRPGRGSRLRDRVKHFLFGRAVA